MVIINGVIGYIKISRSLNQRAGKVNTFLRLNAQNGNKMCEKHLLRGEFHLLPMSLGSALGLAAMMRANMRRAQVLLPEALPEKYRSFAEQTGYLTEFPEDVAETFDAVIILDCASSERIGSGREGAFPREDISILNIDHHPGNSVQAEWSCVQPDAAATAEILVKIAQLIDWKLTPQAATLFLLGIITDTGCFRFSNTSPETLRTAVILGSGRCPGEGNGNPLPVFFPGKSHGPRSLAGYSPWGCKELDTTE